VRDDASAKRFDGTGARPDAEIVAIADDLDASGGQLAEERFGHLR
jgi:hypothetical protein